MKFSKMIYEEQRKITIMNRRTAWKTHEKCVLFKNMVFFVLIFGRNQ